MHSFPLQLTANTRVQKAISPFDKLPTFKQVFLQHISDPTGEFYNLILGNYHVFSTRQQIYDKQTKLTWKEFVDNSSALDGCYQESAIKTVMTLAQLHIDYTRERQVLILLLDKQLQRQIQLLKDERNKLSEAKRWCVHQVKKQLCEWGSALYRHDWNSCSLFWLWY